jgi:hypothetical protein
MRGLDPRIHQSSQESFEEDGWPVRPGHDEKKFRQRDVYHFHARAIYQRFRMTARNCRHACVWRACIAD